MFDLTFSSQYSEIFSKNFLQEIIHPSFERKFSAFLQTTKFKTRHKRPLTLGEIFDRVYKILNVHYRSEYVYKNIIARNLFLDRHSLADARLFTEVLTRDSRADVVIANGTVTCYEIKTELDSLFRLSRQIEANRKIFERIYVVTYPKLADKILHRIESGVGIIEISAENKLHVRKEAESNLSFLQPAYIFSQLRENEYLSIIEQEFGPQSLLPKTRIYSHHKMLFEQLSPEVVHHHFVNVLAKRGNITQIQKNVEKAPESLKSIFLSNYFSEKRSALLFRNLESLTFN